MRAKITYIDHSGFLMELPTAAFLFDYYQGEIPVMDTEKPLIVFVSHRHQDHYNPEIFNLMKVYQEIYFVIAKGVPVKRQIESFAKQGLDLESRLIMIKRNVTEELTLQSGKVLHITTLKSTDEGVAFLLTYEGKKFYHAGDLNQWVWEGESKQYNDNMRAAYLREMEKLAGQEISVAFVPLDPRLEGHAFEGLEVFLQHTKAEHVYPMHFWGEFDLTRKFLKKHPECEQQIVLIKNAGQMFEAEI